MSLKWENFGFGGDGLLIIITIFFLEFASMPFYWRLS
jgi:hypothetical protein